MRRALKPLMAGVRTLITPAMDKVTLDMDMDPEVESQEILQIYDLIYTDAIGLIWEL